MKLMKSMLLFLKSGNEPARETVEVSKLPLGVNVEISMIASL